MKTWPPKDPDETLKYSYEWAPDLAATETLVGFSFTPINAAGTANVGGALDGSLFTVVITGGNDGQEASWTLRVTTSLGQVLEDTVALAIVASSALVSVPYPGGYAEPTAGNLVAVFPEFSAVNPAQIEYYLGRAARSVDTSWTEGDFGHARMLLAAHLMTLSGLGSTSEALAVRNGSEQFRSMAISSLRLERFDNAGAAGKSSLVGTRFGREFRILLRQNRGGPRVTGSVPGGWGDGDKAW